MHFYLNKYEFKLFNSSFYKYGEEHLITITCLIYWCSCRTCYQTCSKLFLLNENVSDQKLGLAQTVFYIRYLLMLHCLTFENNISFSLKPNLI